MLYKRTHHYYLHCAAVVLVGRSGALHLLTDSKQVCLFLFDSFVRQLTVMCLILLADNALQRRMLNNHYHQLAK